jgi:hypothetical protein
MLTKLLAVSLTGSAAASATNAKRGDATSCVEKISLFSYIK